LEGLEIIEILYKELEYENRIDAELYEKQQIRFERKIRNLDHTTLEKETSLIRKGIFDIKSDVYSTIGVPFVRISNLKNCSIDTSDIIYIPENENLNYIETFLSKGDIIISKTANAAASIVDIDNCNTSQDTVAIKLKSTSKLNSYYTVIFLNSKFGLKQMQRWFTGNIQMHLNLTVCKEKLLIPVFTTKFQLRINKLFELSLEKKKFASRKYLQAETILLESLGLKDFSPSSEPVNIKSFKESFGASGRLDAEYYQMKYEQMMTHIQKQDHSLLKDLVMIQKSIEPGSDVYSEDGMPFLRVADYNKFGLNEPEKKLSIDYCFQNSNLINGLKPKKGTILFSKDGSVGNAYLLQKDEELVTSGAILHLHLKRTNDIVPEYLTLVLNSQVVKMQSERDAGGSIILHWRISEIENVLIPIIPLDIQQEIAGLVNESFHLKSKSEQLLETAKRAVEMAIEEGEARAMEWMESQQAFI